MNAPTDRQLDYAESLIARLRAHHNIKAEHFARRTAAAASVAEMSHCIDEMKVLVEELDEDSYPTTRA